MVIGNTKTLTKTMTKKRNC